MADAKRNLRQGIDELARLGIHDQRWVATELIRTLSASEADAFRRVAVTLRESGLALAAGVTAFLCHSTKDKQFVRPLAAYLREHGITVWIDEADLRGGEVLVDRIASAVSEATVVVAVLSENSVRSAWVRKELSLALTGELTRRRTYVIPIIKDSCAVPAFLADKLQIDFRTRRARERNRPLLVSSILGTAVLRIPHRVLRAVGDRIDSER